MRILVVGSGGREHALAWKLAHSAQTKVFIFPGNPGAARVGLCLPGQVVTPATILAAAESIDADLTVIGPEAPLVDGVVDLFHSARRLIFGPTSQAAQLEGSKIFAKNFFQQHNIPTAAFATVDNPLDAQRALDRFTYPVVIKADGLASGKGVVIATNPAEAHSAIESLGPNLVIEEFLQGPEVSFIVLSDGRNVVPLLPCRDHKRIFDGDQGPNTGGMGAYCDPALLDPVNLTRILETIIWPTVEATNFTGFLYAGLIMTPAGPKILEYNVRLGDPETQPLMFQMRTDFAQLLYAAAQGKLPIKDLDWKEGAAACVVLSAAGYPGKPRTGDLITGMPDAEVLGAAVFQAGTRVGWSGPETAGGRVLGVTASGPTRHDAIANAYAAVEKIHFAGMHYRKDIGR
jgi:phosphoribosylamine--glycine ligase